MSNHEAGAPSLDDSALKEQKEDGGASQASSSGDEASNLSLAALSISVLPAAAAASSGPPKLRMATRVQPDSFEVHECFYPRAINSNLHPMVASFLSLGNDRIAERFCHLNPSVSLAALAKLLATPPRFFRWSGADLFNVTNQKGRRQMIVVETNSCPSGQKSMPMTNNETEEDGYHTLMQTAFKNCLEERANSTTNPLPAGGLAVIYDKNPMEAKGYAAAMADVFGEEVLLAELYVAEKDPDPPVRFIQDVMQIRVAKAEGTGGQFEWRPIRAAFRYVTQRPWDRIPISSRTLILNPIIACLAGGRNKMAADKAYEFLNHEIGQKKASTESGLEIRTPETIRDVSKSEVPLWVKSMGGHAVVKVPYSNAGQGVYTITSPAELAAFMNSEERYNKYIVQSLVGAPHWSSVQRGSTYFHTGTIPNKKKQTFVCDLRCQVVSTKNGFQPLAVYARRARLPLSSKLDPSGKSDSWGMLGTNLSIKKENGEWETDTSRLLLMDMKDFNKLGIAIDDLIDAYVQTCLATIAIDRMAIRLTKKSGVFNRELYSSLNADQGLLDEILYSAQDAISDAAERAEAEAASAASTPGIQPIEPNASKIRDISQVVLPSPIK